VRAEVVGEIMSAITDLRNKGYSLDPEIELSNIMRRKKFDDLEALIDAIRKRYEKEEADRIKRMEAEKERKRKPFKTDSEVKQFMQKLDPLKKFIILLYKNNYSLNYTDIYNKAKEKGLDVEVGLSNVLDFLSSSGLLIDDYGYKLTSKGEQVRDELLKDHVSDEMREDIEEFSADPDMWSFLQSVKILSELNIPIIIDNMKTAELIKEKNKELARTLRTYGYGSYRRGSTEFIPNEKGKLLAKKVIELPFPVGA
jgi:hypothetical protein